MRMTSRFALVAATLLAVATLAFAVASPPDPSQFPKLSTTALRNSIDQRYGTQATTGSTSYFGQANVVADLTGRLNRGSVTSFSLILSVQPTTLDTITIGSDVYQFVTNVAGTPVSNNAYVGVPLGTTVAGTRTNLIAAANGTVTSTNIVKTTGAQAVMNGTNILIADEVGTDVRFRGAVNTPVPQDVYIHNTYPIIRRIAPTVPSWVLAEAITSATDVWRCGSVNVNTLAGRASSPYVLSWIRLPVTTAMITNTPMQLDVDFTVAGIVNAFVMRSDTQFEGWDDTMTLANGGVSLAFAGGGDDIANGDVLTILVYGTAAPTPL